MICRVLSGAWYSHRRFGCSSWRCCTAATGGTGSRFRRRRKHARSAFEGRGGAVMRLDRRGAAGRTLAGEMLTGGAARARRPLRCAAAW